MKFDYVTLISYLGMLSVFLGLFFIVKSYKMLSTRKAEFQFHRPTWIQKKDLSREEYIYNRLGYLLIAVPSIFAIFNVFILTTWEAPEIQSAKPILFECTLGAIWMAGGFFIFNRSMKRQKRENLRNNFFNLDKRGWIEIFLLMFVVLSLLP